MKITSMLDVNQNINIRKTWLGGFLLDSPSPYILFNTIPPCPSQTGEGTAVKEEKWMERTFREQ